MADFEFTPAAERWGVFEAALHGEEGNDPFAPGLMQGVFRYEDKDLGAVRVEGFYDGGGVWRVRFMPQFEGKYTFKITAGGTAFVGDFTASKPSDGNHGPVHAAKTYHFAYEDGTPFVPVGTTCYVWELQSGETQQNTLETLESAPFNKMRYCILPKHYIYNFRDPPMFPFEGKPCSTEGMTEENFNAWNGNGNDRGNDWNFDRFVPEYFRNIEKSVLELQKIGVEADLILLHPYDRWGFSLMDAAHDDRYLHYVVSRLSAFRNVWWAMANEWDLMPQKSVADWERMAGVVRSCDPYRHLQSIHNCVPFYDHNRPWITHCSIQRQDRYKTAEFTNEWREKWKKPIVLDEMAYEGNIQFGWGNISAQELVRRFWEAACRGGYGGHGETFMPQLGSSREGVLWWSHGGFLHGESVTGIAFLKQIMEEVRDTGLAPFCHEWDETCAVRDNTEGMAGAPRSYYLFYYGFERPSFRDFHFDDTTRYQVDVIDTWGMTIADAGIHSGRFRVKLPGREWMAVRMRRVQ